MRVYSFMLQNYKKNFYITQPNLISEIERIEKCMKYLQIWIEKCNFAGSKRIEKCIETV